MAGGIIIAVVAAVANAFAVVLQAAEARDTPCDEAARISLLLRLVHRRRWLAGVALLIIAWPLQIIALLYAPITVVQPTLACGQLVLLAMARVKLREQVGLLELAGALAIVAGIALVIWAAPRHTVHEPGVLRVSVPLVVVGMAAVAAFALGRLRPKRVLALVIGAGLAYAWIDFANKLLANDLSMSRWGLRRPGWLPRWPSGRWPSWRRRPRSSSALPSPWPPSSARCRTRCPCSWRLPQGSRAGATGPTGWSHWPLGWPW